MRPKTTAPNLDFPRPLACVDVIVFTVMADTLHVLLARRPQGPDEPFAGQWCLPGGFIDMAQDASLLDCALRKLRDKTGFASPYLEQLGSWGSATRDPRGWSATHAYFALVPPPVGMASRPSPSAPTQADRDAEWLPADHAATLPLAFDHGDILRAALARLRSKVEYTSLPAFLLPEPFTLPELQRAYEVVLARPLDKSAFRRRMLDAGFLEEVGQLAQTVGRPALGYRVLARERAAVFPRTFRAGEAGGD